MKRELSLVVHPDWADDAGLRACAAHELSLNEARITGLSVQHRAVDARRGRVLLTFKVEVTVDEPPEPRTPPAVPELPALGDIEPPVIIVGAGPAGLYAAWTLARLGVRSHVVERGADVRGRRPALARLNREGVLDPDTNYCFGEGGAGTFSDGKLYTRATKRGQVSDFFAFLVSCGAPERILWDSRPHIGTNRLPQVVSAWRAKLEAAGVQFTFGSRVTELLVKERQVRGVGLASGDKLSARAVILGTGHSARDVYRQLHHQGVALTPKPFALGVRAEHPQALIDTLQYGALAGHPQLGAASYSLTRTEAGVGVYSFCMCPGGFMVAAATETDGVVVNGMSPQARGSRFANSGMVVTVGPEVFGEGPLAGLEWQAAVERAAFVAGGGAFKAPAVRLTDFLKRRLSTDLPSASYRPGLTPADLYEVLPARIALPLADGLRFFDRERMRGYATEEAILVGVESRSSSPVRVERDPETLESPSHAGLFPTGEGAGYAGGIASAALDGARVAEAVARALGTG